MGRWVAIANESVRKEHLSAILETEGTSWEQASHVTATTSLAQAIRAGKSGQPAIPIATLVDLIVMPGLPAELALSLDGYPSPSLLRDENLRAYGDAIDSWQRMATGRRIRTGIQFDDCLRRFVRTSAKGEPAGRVLVSARRDFARSIHTLVAAGVEPHDLAPQDPLGKLAVEVWRQAEVDVPGLTSTRDDLWVDWDEFDSQTTSHARALRQRITNALERAFGPVGQGNRVIVHHGFYFFTPPQWALFQLLRRMPDVDQIFIVHDDGRNRAFETWRRYFNEKWHMPKPRLGRAGGGCTLPAAALRDALSGERIDPEALASSLRVLECRSPAELVREWRHATTAAGENGASIRRYAADAKSVDRFVRRLGKEVNSGAVDLAQLPIGAFLLAVHDCIQPLAAGGYEVHLSNETLVDIAGSGYLEVKDLGSPAAQFVSALRRALPFFAGCITAADWVDRSEVLRRLILDEVEPLGGRSSDANDLERMRSAVNNPLRLAPWADITVDQANGIAAIIDATVALVAEIAGRERVVLKDHLNFLRAKLHAGMRQLAPKERNEIAAKVEGFSVGLDEEIDVEGLVDVVSMLLGRKADFDATGEDQVLGGTVGELRSLDALSFNRLDHDVHVANLADGTFPGRVPTVGWPFRLEDLRAPAATIEPVVMEILEARTENAALSDLYLLWLALDGVEPGKTLTLSWISDMGGEPRNASSLLSLLTLPRGAPPSVRERAGGLTVEGITAAGLTDSLTTRPSPKPASATPADLAGAATRLEPAVAAASHACARRFAIQWALGPSAAYQSEHHHVMLYGNELGALMRLSRYSLLAAYRACNDLWRFLTPGQRASSVARARVKTAKGSAHGRWILTLAGSKSGQDPMDRAYQAALDDEAPQAKLLAPADSGYLPVGVNDPAVCNHCPVRARCLSWDRPE